MAPSTSIAATYRTTYDRMCMILYKDYKRIEMYTDLPSPVFRVYVKQFGWVLVDDLSFMERWRLRSMWLREKRFQCRIEKTVADRSLRKALDAYLNSEEATGQNMKMLRPSERRKGFP